jgi:hypothetical protein
MLDEAGRAHSSIDAASIHVGGPVAAPWAKGGIAHQRL